MDNILPNNEEEIKIENLFPAKKTLEPVTNQAVFSKKKKKK
jgi:hypothetical protein